MAGEGVVTKLVISGGSERDVAVLFAGAGIHFVFEHAEGADEFLAVIENKIKPFQAKEIVKRTAKPAQVKDIEKQLKNSLRMKVLVKGSEETGKLTINYANADELLRLQTLLMKGSVADE